MHDPNWRHGLTVLERLGLSYDLRVPYWHLHEAADVLGVHSKLQVALNHTGFHGIEVKRVSNQGKKQCEQS